MILLILTIFITIAFLTQYQYKYILLQFHQTVKTYLKDCVWEFHFYVSKDWPNDPICLHFPGMTSSVSNTFLGVG